MWPFVSERAIVAFDLMSLAVLRYDGRGGAARAMFEEVFRSAPIAPRPEAALLGAVAAGPALADDAAWVHEARVRLSGLPKAGLTIVLPVGATFAAVVDTSGGDGERVGRDAIIRFRMASSLPFPAPSAVIRRDERVLVRPGAVFAEALSPGRLDEGKRLAAALGFDRCAIHSALGATLRCLPPRADTVDLILGDAAYAVVERDERGAVASVTLRLLGEGSDRHARALAFATRGARESTVVRVAGLGSANLLTVSAASHVVAAFSGHQQTWPFAGFVAGLAGDRAA
jgi:hypothetical protein